MGEMIIQIVDIFVQAIAIIASGGISIFITNKQIKNQNKETYRPRLKLKTICNRHHTSNRPEYMAFSYKYSERKEKFNSYILICLENIGNGLANDITFYDLIHGERCAACQTLDLDYNQRIYSTEEVPKGKTIAFPFWITLNSEYILNENNSRSESDFTLLICNYKDLNNNNYKILIYYSPKKLDDTLEDEAGEIIENACKIDYYYYQEGTYHFKKMVDRYNDNYKKIETIIKKEDKYLRK